MLGGASKSLIDLAHMLMKRHNVTVCLPENANSARQLLEGLGIRTCGIKASIPMWLYYSGGCGIISPRSFELLHRLSKNNIRLFVQEVEKTNPDVIIFNSIVSSITAKYFNTDTKKLVVIRETFNRTVFDNIYRYIFRNYIDGICSIAKSELTYINLPDKNQCLIPDCLTPDDISVISRDEACGQLSLPKDRFNILFMGGLELIKGTDILFSALDSINSKINVIVAGNFDVNKLSSKSIKKLILHPRARRFYHMVSSRYNAHKDQIYLLGFRTNGLNAAYCAADVVVFPSTFPHQPRPCIEAGAYSKPVILSDYEITKDFFINDYNALTFPAKDSKKLAEKIEILASNHELRKRMGENNWIMTQREHSYAKTEETLLSFIDEVCCRK